MKAQRVLQIKQTYGAGVVEIVIWRVPKPVPPSEHAYKYRLVYVVGGQRVLGYDNERGKGDHKHVGPQQEAYRFTSPQQLMADFMADLKEHSHDATGS